MPQDNIDLTAGLVSPKPDDDGIDLSAGIVTPKKPPKKAYNQSLLDFAKSQNLKLVGSAATGRVPSSGHNKGSRHYAGEAIDIDHNGVDIDALSRLAAEQGFKLRDERTRPKGQAVWGGPHVHIEVEDGIDISAGISGSVPSTASTEQTANAPIVAPRPKPQPVSISGNDLKWHYGLDFEEFKKLTPKQQKSVIARTQQAVKKDEQKKTAGQQLSPSLDYINQNRKALGIRSKSLVERSGLPSQEENPESEWDVLGHIRQNIRQDEKAKSLSNEDALQKAKQRGISVSQIRRQVEAELSRPETYSDQHGTRQRMSTPNAKKVESETLNRVKAAIAEAERKERVSQTGWGEYLAQYPKSVITGTAGGAETLLKGLATAGKKVASTVIDTSSVPTDQSHLYRLGDYIGKRSKEIVQSNPDLEQEFFVGKAPNVVGQMAVTLLGGAVTKSPKLVVSILSGGQIAGDTYDEAREAGASDDEAVNAGLIAAGILTPFQVLGMRRGLNALNAAKASSVRDALKQAAITGSKDALENIPEEVLEELVQGQASGRGRTPGELLEAGALAITAAPVSAGSSLAGQAKSALKDRTKLVDEDAASEDFSVSETPEIPMQPRSGKRMATPEERELLTRVIGENRERRSAERKGETDELTGVANQSALIKAMPAAEKDPNITVISTDIGNLKAANTILGREGGDAAIKEAAQALQQAAKENGENRVFRDSGDEIIALVPNDKADAISQRAAELFKARKAGDYDVTLDIGVGQTRKEADAQLKTIKGSREKSFRKVEDRVQEQSTNKIDVQKAPGDSTALGAGIRSTKQKSTRTRTQEGQSQVATQSAPELEIVNVAQAPIRKNLKQKLTPAVESGARETLVPPTPKPVPTRDTKIIPERETGTREITTTSKKTAPKHFSEQDLDQIESLRKRGLSNEAIAKELSERRGKDYLASDVALASKESISNRGRISHAELPQNIKGVYKNFEFVPEIGKVKYEENKPAFHWDGQAFWINDKLLNRLGQAGIIPSRDDSRLAGQLFTPEQVRNIIKSKYSPALADASDFVNALTKHGFDGYNAKPTVIVVAHADRSLYDAVSTRSHELTHRRDWIDKHERLSAGTISKENLSKLKDVLHPLRNAIVRGTGVKEYADLPAEYLASEVMAHFAGGAWGKGNLGVSDAQIRETYTNLIQLLVENNIDPEYIVEEGLNYEAKEIAKEIVAKNRARQAEAQEGRRTEERPRAHGNLQTEGQRRLESRTGKEVDIASPESKSPQVESRITDFFRRKKEEPKAEPGRKRERSFPKSAEQVGHSNATDITYNELSNEASRRAAQARIDKDGPEKAMRKLAQATDIGAEEIATGLLLAKKFQKDGDTENEVAVIDDLARKLTRAGQVVQAASMVSRLSPEGALIRATRIVQKRRPGTKITKEEATAIKTQAEKTTKALSNVARVAEKEQKSKEPKADSGTVAAKVEAKLAIKANEARAKIAELRSKSAQLASLIRLPGTPKNLPPALQANMPLYVAVGAHEFAKLRGVRKMERWKKEMIALEPKLAPYITGEVFAKSFKLYDDTRKSALDASRLASAAKANPAASSAQLRAIMNEKLDAQTEARRESIAMQRMYNELARPNWNRTLRLAGDTIGLWRALEASADLSATFRQSKAAMLRHPVIWSRAFSKQIKAFKTSEYERLLSAIELDPDFKYAKRFGLDLTGLGEHEEGFQSGIARKLPITKHSEQAYTTMLNYTRMGWFKQYTEGLRRLGLDPDNNADRQHFEKGAQLINNATGRGDWGKNRAGQYLRNFSGALSQVLFSPRFLASRLSMLAYALNPRNTLNPTVVQAAVKDVFGVKRKVTSEEHRVEAVKTVASFTALVGMQLALAHLIIKSVSDDEEDGVTFNINSPDFLKAKLGKYHVDFSAGHQGIIRMFLRTFSSIKNADQDRGKGPLDIQGDFWRKKLSPAASIINDMFFHKQTKGFGLDWQGEDFLGEPEYMFGKPGTGLNRVNPLSKEGSILLTKLMPMIVEDTKEAVYDQTPDILTPAAIASSVLGDSVQVYDSKKKKPTRGRLMF